MPPGGPPLEQLTGFENHAGVTMLGPKAQPLGRLVAGVGNGDGTEGAVSGRVVGTYLHGPVLARNPALADLLLGWALRGSMSLAPLDDHLIDQPPRPNACRRQSAVGAGVGPRQKAVTFLSVPRGASHRASG